MEKKKLPPFLTWLDTAKTNKGLWDEYFIGTSIKCRKTRHQTKLGDSCVDRVLLAVISDLLNVHEVFSNFLIPDLQLRAIPIIPLHTLMS